MSVSEVISTQEMKVQEMSMQWISMRRTAGYLSQKKSSLDGTSLGKIAKTIVKQYNNNHPDSLSSYQYSKCDFKDPHYKLKVFVRAINFKPGLTKEFERLGVEEGKIETRKTGNIALLFFCSSSAREIVALSTSSAWNVVRECIAFDFPTRIGERILDPTQISKITRYSLVGANTTEKITNPSQTELYKTSSLYSLVERVEAVVKRHSSLLSLSPFSQTSMKKKSPYTPKVSITSAGLLRIHCPLSLTHYPPILNLFRSYILGEETYSNRGRLETADQRFEFLHFIKPAKAPKNKLDAHLVSDIFKRYQNGIPLEASFRHKYLDKYLHSTQFEIQFKKKGRYKTLSKNPPTLEEVIDAIQSTVKKFSAEILLTTLKEGKLRYFNPMTSTYEESPLIDYLEGEVHVGEKGFFKARGGMWYQLSVDFHALIHDDFRTLLSRTLISPGDLGYLPHKWRGNKPLDLLTENHVKKVRGTGRGIRNFMQTLEKTSVRYVESSGEINQTQLVGEILEIVEVAKNKEAIEKELSTKSASPLEARLRKIAPKEGRKILKELQKERKVLEVKTRGKNRKERRVINPLVYPLKKQLKAKEQPFATLLEELYNNRIKVKEESYNRGYLFDTANKGKLFGPEEGYLVFDQVTPHNIELCDLIRYTPTTTLIYHVKEEFGQHTRVAVSQILNGAKELRSALSLHQPQNYLQLLWKEGTKTSHTTGWKAAMKKQLEALGQKNFLKLFYHRKIVFVYAYLVKPGWSLHSESSTPTILSQADLPGVLDNPEIRKQLMKDQYLDSRNRLTGKFYASKKETFLLKGFEAKSPQIYTQLSKFDSVSQSTLAKLDLINLSRELEALNFELKLCEIERATSSQLSPSQVSSSQPTPLTPTDSPSLSEEDEEDFSFVGLTDDFPEGPFSGLHNIGNSCYINAVLQAFHYLEPILTQIEQKKSTKGIPKALAQALVKRDYSSLFRLREEVFSKENEQLFDPTEKLAQQDAALFLTLLLDKLVWTPMQYYTVFFYHLPGIEKRTYHTSGKTPCHSLKVGVEEQETRGFQALLSDYFRSEPVINETHPLVVGKEDNPLVKGTTKYNISTYSRAERVSPLPEILIVQLKRFQSNQSKIETAISFPEDGRITLQLRKNDPITTYEIVAFINHHGRTIHAGHYTADVKELGEEEERWIHCDDERVKIAPPKNPAKEAYIVILKKVTAPSG